MPDNEKTGQDCEDRDVPPVIEQSVADIFRWTENRSGGQPVTNSHQPWHGAGLFTNTTVRALTLADLPQVEQCYNESLLPEAVILQIAGKTNEQIQKILGIAPSTELTQRGGMLNEFRTRPIHAQNPDKATLSEFERMEKDLTEAEQIRGKQYPRGAKAPALFEGAVLVPKSDQDYLYAWATWWRSPREKASERNLANDKATARVRNLFSPHGPKRNIQLRSRDMDWRTYQRRASKTILFDTINRRKPGAADLLMNNLIDPWLRQEYERIIAYRWAGMKPESDNEPTDVRHFDPGNVDSEYFFRRLGFHEIGTRVSLYRALRTVKGEQYVIEGTEGWMEGQLDVMQCKSDARIRELKDRFGL